MRKSETIGESVMKEVPMKTQIANIKRGVLWDGVLARRGYAPGF
jgi:hypothetical protein